MGKFWIYHRDDHGELHSVGDEPWQADTADEALAEMLREAGAEDDGRYRATRPDPLRAAHGRLD